MKTLNVVGSGRVGRTLARLFREQAALEIQDIKASRFEAADAARAFIGAGRPVARIDDMRPADIWMLTVPDTRVAEVAAEIAASLSIRVGASRQRTVAFHCSGFLGASALGPLKVLGWQAASVHPVLNFASAETGVAQFPGTPCGFEGDAEAQAILKPVFAAIGAKCFPVMSEYKALYHAAAVFSSNFTVVLQAIAGEAWAAAGVPEEMAHTIQESLIRATMENVIKLGAKAITGPAARGDSKVVLAQGNAVTAWHPEAGQIYRQMSELARRLAENQSTLPSFQTS